MRPYALIGKQIKEARQLAKISQKNLADRVAISQRSLRELENGRRYCVDWFELEAIASFLNLEIK